MGEAKFSNLTQKDKDNIALGFWAAQCRHDGDDDYEDMKINAVSNLTWCINYLMKKFKDAQRLQSEIFRLSGEIEEIENLNCNSIVFEEVNGGQLSLLHTINRMMVEKNEKIDRCFDAAESLEQIEKEIKRIKLDLEKCRFTYLNYGDRNQNVDKIALNPVLDDISKITASDLTREFQGYDFFETDEKQSDNEQAQV